MESNGISLESSKKLISCNMYTLKVPNFFTLPRYHYGSFEMNSPSFEFEDATWCFRCLPEGYENGYDGDIYSFRFDICILKTEFSSHTLLFKVALFKPNNLKCDDSQCGITTIYKKTPNHEQLHHFKNNCTYHDGYEPLTIIVHLFPLETVEVDPQQATLSTDSLHKRTSDMKDCKISLESTNETVFSDFFSLKLPCVNQKPFNTQFKLDNAMCCIHISSKNSYSFAVRLERLNGEKSLKNIFVKSILTDSNDKIISNHFEVLKFNEDSLGSFLYPKFPFCTLHVYLLKEKELDVDANPIPITKTRVNTTSAGHSLRSISSTVSNSTPPLFDASKNVTPSVPSFSTNESKSAISTSEPSSATSVSVPSFSTNESNPAISPNTSDSGLLCRDFKKLFLNEVDCDLTLKVAGKEFKVHRLILRARSQVFEAMLSHDMIEQNKGIIDIPDIDAQAMELLLTYVYCEEVDTLNEGNVLGVYYAADKYNMIPLKDKCSEFIRKSLSTSIICDAIELALNHDDRELLECCTEYFVNHVSDILPTVKWMSFIKANPIAANELFIKTTKK